MREPKVSTSNDVSREMSDHGLFTDPYPELQYVAAQKHEEIGNKSSEKRHRTSREETTEENTIMNTQTESTASNVTKTGTGSNADIVMAAEVMKNISEVLRKTNERLDAKEGWRSQVYEAAKNGAASAAFIGLGYGAVKLATRFFSKGAAVGV